MRSRTFGANNGKGGSGVAPNCRVLPVRIAQGGGQDVRLNRLLLKANGNPCDRAM